MCGCQQGRLPVRGDRAADRARIDRAALNALRFLVANGSSGMWSGGNGSPLVTTAVAGLAMLGAAPGGGPLAPLVHKVKAQMVRSRQTKDGQPTDSIFTSWLLGFRGLFLAEYYGRYPTPDVRAALKENADLIAKITNEAGCWHHGYGAQRKYEVHAAGIECLAALGMARSVGIEIDESVMAKSLQNLAPANGRVGYSRKNKHFAPGRALGAAWRLRIG